MPTAQTRLQKLDLRLTPAAKKTLQLAAQASGCSVNEFVLQSACTRADETLRDRWHFGLDAEQWAVFQKALDAPAQPVQNLAKLFEVPSVFERER